MKYLSLLFPGASKKGTVKYPTAHLQVLNSLKVRETGRAPLNWVWFILFFVLFSISCKKSIPPQKPFISQTPVMLGCESEYKKLDLTFQSEVMIHGSFFKNPPTAHEVRPFLNEQMKFLYGTFHDGRPFKNFNFFVSNEPSQFSAIEIHSDIYGVDINLDQPDSPRASDYLNHLTAKKINPRKKDPSYLVKFTARVNAHFCGANPPEEVSLTLPKDPFLAYWSMDESDRRVMKNQHLTHRMNPCAHDEFVEIKSPTFFWYSWFPHRRSKDAEGRDFDCQNLLKNIISTRASVKSLNPPLNKIDFFWRKKQDLSLSIIYGRIQNSPDDVNKISALFKKLTSHPPASWSQFKKEIQDSRDLGLFAFVQFIQEVSQKFKGTFSYHPERQVFEAQIRKGGKVIKLKAYFGNTDLGDGKDKLYASNLLDFLENSDLLFYFGHSGMGWNFEFKRLIPILGISEEEFLKKIRAKEKVFHSFMGCYTASYVGEELLNLRKGLHTGLALSAVRHFVFNFPQLMLEDIFFEEEKFYYPPGWKGIIYLYWI